MTTLSVDPTGCTGHRVCAELFPEWVRLDDWGYPIVRTEALPPELLARARWTVANCPALALRLGGPPESGQPGGALAPPGRAGSGRIERAS